MRAWGEPGGLGSPWGEGGAKIGECGPPAKEAPRAFSDPRRPALPSSRCGVSSSSPLSTGFLGDTPPVPSGAIGLCLIDASVSLPEKVRSWPTWPACTPPAVLQMA